MSVGWLVDWLVGRSVGRSVNFLKRATSYTSILLSEHPFIGCAQCSVGHPAGWPVKGAAGPGSAAPAPARAILRAGEDREVATDALPHAHQPGDARVRLPCVRHATMSPTSTTLGGGGSPAAPEQREAGAGGPH